MTAFDISIRTNFRLSQMWRELISLLLLQFAAVSALAQLPELPLPSSATGLPTSAIFYAGTTADGGASFATSFAAEQEVSIFTDIHVEPEHVNSVGNLYLIIALGDENYIRVESGDYELWDGELETLKASFPGKTLQADEAYTVLEDVSFGALGMAGAQLYLYLAYDTVAAVGELFYSGEPMSLQIDAAATVAPSYQVFIDEVSASIIQSRCIICHSSTGIAAATNSSSQLQYLSSSEANFQQANYNTLVNYIQNVSAGSELLLSKPQGVDHVGGVQLVAGSAEVQVFEQFVNAVAGE